MWIVLPVLFLITVVPYGFCDTDLESFRRPPLYFAMLTIPFTRRRDEERTFLCSLMDHWVVNVKTRRQGPFPFGYKCVFGYFLTGIVEITIMECDLCSESCHLFISHDMDVGPCRESSFFLSRCRCHCCTYLQVSCHNSLFSVRDLLCVTYRHKYVVRTLLFEYVRLFSHHRRSPISPALRPSSHPEPIFLVVLPRDTPILQDLGLTAVRPTLHDVLTFCTGDTFDPCPMYLEGHNK